MAFPFPSVLYIAMVAIKVFPEAVGAQASSDVPSSKPAFTAFSWIGVRVLNLVYCFLNGSGKGRELISIYSPGKMNLYMNFAYIFKIHIRNVVIEYYTTHFFIIL